MPPQPGSASKDPFVDSSNGGNHTADNPDNAQFPVSEGKALLFSMCKTCCASISLFSSLKPVLAEE